jgi:hypothetical protein
MSCVVDVLALTNVGRVRVEMIKEWLKITTAYFQAVVILVL